MTEQLALALHPTLRPAAGPLVLLVMDGVGVGRADAFDAVAAARTPNLDRLRAGYLYRTLRAHGRAVGLPSDRDQGNSEVGHNIMGAGRIVDQGASRVDNAIASGGIWTGIWRDLVARVVERSSTLHLIGLLSDGNVHSNLSHLEALVERAVAEGVTRIRVHALLDGRDVREHSADAYVRRVEAFLQDVSARTGADCAIASGGGRMVTTMDRYEANWSIVEAGWRAHVLGAARPAGSALEAIERARAEQPGISDQVIPAFSVRDANGDPLGPILDGDSVVFFNFRGDRAIEFSRAIEAGEEFEHFDRVRAPDVLYAGMSLYDGDTHVPANYLCHETVERTVSERLTASGVSQLACAETQKYGHLTYFWNGNRSEPFDPVMEQYEEIPSTTPVTFDETPTMRAAETGAMVVEAVVRRSHAFIRANYAGGDMVGHTGNFAATVEAVEAVDASIGAVAGAVEAAQGCLVITADHGNAEDMVERDAAGEPLRDAEGAPLWRTAHSVNPVPLYVADFDGRGIVLRNDLPDAGLANLAATLVELLGFAAPDEYCPSVIRPAG